MIKTLLFIGAGSFAGGIARYLLTKGIHSAFGAAFPAGTFTVNITGCFLIGILSAIAAKSGFADNNLRLMLTVGFCGGFTTFSTFANESFLMLQGSQFLQASLYAVLSMAAGLVAVWLGYQLINIFS